MNKIKAVLLQTFEKHRIIFWYDEKKELKETYEELDFPDVEKMIINNNEFHLKYTILIEKPAQKFLLYHEGAKPPDLENWLLDLLLSHAEFSADQIAMYLTELELDTSFRDLVSCHHDFFRSDKRRKSLKAILNDTDNACYVNDRTTIDLKNILEKIAKENSGD